MIKIDFEEPDDPAWAEWTARCAAATATLIGAFQNGEHPQISKRLYKEQKHVFLDQGGPFHGKCAYCETLRAADQRSGDVEHFRPKGRLTDFENRPIMITDTSGVETPHPGYYWLAYDWRNLLPACIDCNRISIDKPSGRRIGKWDYFPVKNTHAAHPGDENEEEPLLINPVFQYPERHLMIDDTGIFTAVTPEGQECIDVFGLNIREPLVNSRRWTYGDVKTRVHALFDALYNEGAHGEALLAELSSIKRGERAYSAAARLAIRDGEALHKEKLDRIASL